MGAKEYKTVDGLITAIDEDQGLVTAIFAVMGNIDSGLDRIHNGAFTKTFAERGHRVRVLDHHNAGSVRDAIAKPVRLREVGLAELPIKILEAYPDATGGAELTAKFMLDDPDSMAVFRRLKADVIDEWSFGYDPLDFDYTKESIGGKEATVRNLRTLRLWEVSPVLWGMNEATTTTGIKATGARRNFPIGDRGRAWDAAAAVDRWRRASGSEDEPSATYKQGFFWYDGENSDLFTAYKLPFVDVVSGTATAIPRGIFAGAQRLPNTAIPAADKEQVRAAMGAYYKRMRSQFDDDSIVAPWDKSGKGEKPYRAFPEDGRYCVYKIDEETGERVGDSLGCHDTEEEANAQVRALYAAENADKSENWTERMNALNAAVRALNPDPAVGSSDDWYWIQTIFEDHVIVHYESATGATYFLVPYAYDAGQVELAARSEWVEGVYDFIPRVAEQHMTSPGFAILRAAWATEQDLGRLVQLCSDKEGRVLSARNGTRIANAVVALVELLEDAGIELPGLRRASDDTEDPESPGKADSGPQQTEDGRADDGSPTMDGLDRISVLEAELSIIGV